VGGRAGGPQRLGGTRGSIAPDISSAQGDHEFVADEDSEVRVTVELGSNRVRRMVVYRNGITMRAERLD
jgi:hypothetical protein